MKTTGPDIYKLLEQSGDLSERRLRICKILSEAPGAMTHAEILQELNRQFGVPINPTGGGSRMSELEKLGVVEEVGKKQCTVTQRDVTAYVLTGRMPSERPQKKTPREFYLLLNEQGKIINCAENPGVITPRENQELLTVREVIR